MCKLDMIDRIGITECPNALWGNDLFLDRIFLDRTFFDRTFLDRINRIYRIGIAGGWNTSPVIARSVATKQPSRSLRGCAWVASSCFAVLAMTSIFFSIANPVNPVNPVKKNSLIINPVKKIMSLLGVKEGG